MFGRTLFLQQPQTQIEAIRTYMGDLSPLELKAVFMRFWGPCSVAQVASELRLSWVSADRVIDRTVARLRARCAQDGIQSIADDQAKRETKFFDRKEQVNGN